MRPRGHICSDVTPVHGPLGRLCASRARHGRRTTMTEQSSQQGTPQVAVLGGGVMGETLLSALLAAGWGAAQVEVTERAVERAGELAKTYGVRTGASNAQAAGRADVVLIAVKPNVVASVLDEIRPVL